MRWCIKYHHFQFFINHLCHYIVFLKNIDTWLMTFIEICRYILIFYIICIVHVTNVCLTSKNWTVYMLLTFFIVLWCIISIVRIAINISDSIGLFLKLLYSKCNSSKHRSFFHSNNFIMGIKTFKWYVWIVFTIFTIWYKRHRFHAINMSLHVK